MIITYAQMQAIDAAFHDAAGAVQHAVCSLYGINCATPEDAEKLREASAEMVKRFAEARAAYVAAKGGLATAETEEVA